MEIDDFYTLVNQPDAEFIDKTFEAGSSSIYFPDGGMNELGSEVARVAN